MEKFLERLRMAVTQRGALSKLARMANLPKATVWRIAKGETANPGYETVQSIERALDELDSAPSPSGEVVAQ